MESAGDHDTVLEEAAERDHIDMVTAVYSLQTAVFLVLPSVLSAAPVSSLHRTLEESKISSVCHRSCGLTAIEGCLFSFCSA